MLAMNTFVRTYVTFRRHGHRQFEGTISELSWLFTDDRIDWTESVVFADPQPGSPGLSGVIMSLDDDEIEDVIDLAWAASPPTELVS